VPIPWRPPAHLEPQDRDCTRWPAGRAADVIVRIANEAKSDSVRLRAARAIFSDMMTVTHYNELEGRMAGIEDKLRKRASATSSAIASRTPASYGQGAPPPAMLPVTSTTTGAG
jgi:hypothetical protein